MDVFSQYSSESECGSARAVHLSDEEILLASRNPKKRAGRKKFKETRHPVYRGVRRRNSDKWVCEVREPSKQARIWLGTFPTAEMAARAHDVAAIALRGRSACLNFAESAWLQVPTSGDPKEIQRMAAEAAEKFRPEEAKVEEKRESPESVFFMDEEAVFGMPGLLSNMAEGMLLPPPYYIGDDGSGGDDKEASADVSLWSFSI